MGSVKTWVKQMRNRTQNWDVWYIDTVVKQKYLLPDN